VRTSPEQGPTKGGDGKGVGRGDDGQGGSVGETMGKEISYGDAM